MLNTEIENVFLLPDISQGPSRRNLNNSTFILYRELEILGQMSQLNAQYARNETLDIPENEWRLVIATYNTFE